MNIPALKEIIEERKEKAIETLSDCFAKNRLPLEEYERLVEYIHKTESERELAVVEKIVAEYSRDTGSGGLSGSSGAYGDDQDDQEESRHSDFSGSSLTILSSRTISGPLKSGSEFVSILGSTRIKVRKQDLAKKSTSLNLATILGDYVVYVEPGIRVINNAIPILGSARVDHRVNDEAPYGAPELVISGAAILGDIKVKLLKE